eukprot:TRINITY_DN1446_c0_g1_i2.p2 TRINITY_DN1446_c0_g1~~TRINITY_DN1446_c0_g1_i2.p2  ORF type:complete len:119 (-),score=32.90 TRINITY_DN1446_c0_g1_i2:362-718(-)
MQELYQKYHDQGLEILGFPSAQFFQELPTNQEIKDFVSGYGVTFRIMDKVAVNGSDAHPLWTFLKETLPDGWFSMIKWNFTKFLVDRDGVPFKRYGTTVDPIEIENDIIALLKKSPSS